MERIENKYFISKATFFELKNILSNLLILDKNCKNLDGYSIRSLYLDDFYNSELNKKINGEIERCKLRLRCYNNDLSNIFLEVKKKKNFLSKKNKIKLNFDDAKKLIYENSNNFSSNKKLEDFIKSYNYQKIIPKLLLIIKD